MNTWHFATEAHKKMDRAAKAVSEASDEDIDGFIRDFKNARIEFDAAVATVALCAKAKESRL